MKEFKRLSGSPNSFVEEEKSCEECSECLPECGKRTKEIGKALGWGIICRQFNGERLIRKEEGKELRKQENGSLYYAVQGWQELSAQEALLVKEAVKEFQSKETENGKEKELKLTFREYCEKNGIQLSEEQKETLPEMADSLVYGFGPLNALMEDQEIEEITVSGFGQENPVRAFLAGMGWSETNIYIPGEKNFIDLVNRMALGSGRRISLSRPSLNAHLKDGSRIKAIISPLSAKGASLNIRKFSPTPFTPLDLISTETIDAEQLAFLWMALLADTSIIVAGNTSSGKTTTLNALFYFIPREERIVSVEETLELRLPQKHWARLTTGEEKKASMSGLIYETLRMRPDRIIVGEVRKPEEAKAMADTLLAGQGKGSAATFHAQSARETVNRLKSFGINETELGGMDLIVVQKRWGKEDLENRTRRQERKVAEIAEICLNPEGKLELNPLWEYSHRKKKWEKKFSPKKVLPALEKCFGANKKGIQKEIRKRKKLLEKMAKKGLTAKQFLEEVN